MPYAKVTSAQPYFLDGMIVSVEVDISRGLHSFSIVGLGDKAVEESKDRISAALKNSGFDSPKSKNHKVVISLSPANIKKTGSYFDLPIAIGYLLATGGIKASLNDKVFLGELTLAGTLLPVRGVLALAEIAKKKGYRELYVPIQNAPEAALVDGIDVYGVRTLFETVLHITNDARSKLQPTLRVHNTEKTKNENDISHISGQETAKRALEIAAAGGHNIAFIGPPGTGKTLLARALISILPPLNQNQILEVTKIHSITGNLIHTSMDTPPFRAPHHTASYTAMIGGGSHITPGEITLAHRGVLFLDEFPEFDKRVIESLRQPLEDNSITLTRTTGAVVFPSNFILVAAMNPCPCGYKGSHFKQCTCSRGDIDRYNRKLSGPIIDRIDLWVTVAQIEYEKLFNETPCGEPSVSIQKRVITAQEKMHARSKKYAGKPITNAEMTGEILRLCIQLENSAQKILDESAKKLHLSGRSYHRTIKVAQTIADLAESTHVTREHILEALQYRPRF